MLGRLVSLCLAIAMSGCTFHVKGAPTGGDTSAPDLATDGADFAAAPIDLASADLTSADLALPRDLAPPPGELTVTRDEVPGTVDLTVEGTIDWAHFGRNSAGDVNRKSGGPGEIAVGTIGATLAQFNSYTPSLRWSNGTPTANASTKGGVYLRGIDHAITLTVPADATTRTVRAYLTHYQTTAQLAVHLSDGSAADYSTMLTTGANSYYRVTVEFRARSAGQTLTITWTERADTGGGFGSVDLLGASVY